MYGGKAVEQGSSQDLFKRPEHPYTWGLLTSVPRMDRLRTDRLIAIQGSPPSLINIPSGCAFHPRCPYAGRTEGRSATEVPALTESTRHHLVACHLDAETRRAIWTDEIAPKL
jgi:peptide/nickel transport system ATP-binding protein